MASDTAQRCQGLQVSLADLDAEFERLTMGFESNVAGDPEEDWGGEVRRAGARSRRVHCCQLLRRARCGAERCTHCLCRWPRGQLPARQV